jgi:hypothetical protein
MNSVCLNFKFVKWFAPIAGTLLLILASCVGERPETGPRVEEYRSVDLLGAGSVRTEIEMKAGTLRIGGGAEALMEADFIYNVAEWKPVVTYEVEEGRGDLLVRMPESEWSSFGEDVKYEWDLRLNDDVPMEMFVELGAGESRLDLASLSLTRLKVMNGAGETHVDVGGNPTLERLNIYTGAGEVELDLTGRWDHDLDASIKGGVGEITVRLPDDVGVRVDASKGIGSIKAHGFTKEGGDYVNEAYGKSGVTLSIDINAGIGEIRLETGEVSGGEGTII